MNPDICKNCKKCIHIFEMEKDKNIVYAMKCHEHKTFYLNLNFDDYQVVSKEILDLFISSNDEYETLYGLNNNEYIFKYNQTNDLLKYILQNYHANKEDCPYYIEQELSDLNEYRNM